MTKNYLRFLVDRIVVTGPEVEIHARSDAAVQMMAGPTKTGPGLTVPARSPTTVVDWLQLLDSNQRQGG